MEEDYFGTIRELNHYFGSHVSMARLRHKRGRNDKCNDLQTAFIERLESSLREDIPETQGVTRAHLRELIEIAQGDWSDTETLKQLYMRKFEIKGEEYNEQKLFGKK